MPKLKTNKAASKRYGFTARKMISDSTATVSLSKVVRIPYCSESVSSVTWVFALAIRWLAGTRPEEIIPPIMARPILPLPIKPIFLSNMMHSPFMKGDIPDAAGISPLILSKYKFN